MLRGLVMDDPLLISSLLEHAAQNHSDTEIVSRTVEGPDKESIRLWICQPFKL